MKNMKKLLALLLAMACVLTMAACGGKEEPAETPTNIEEEKQDVFDVMEEIAEENNAAGVGTYVVAPEADFIWEDMDGGVAVTAYIGSDTAIEIPAQLGGKDVLEIRGGTFDGTAVAGVKLPDTLVAVGENAFYYVTTLVEVTLGANVQAIEANAFHGCASLSKVILNNGIQTVGDGAFANTMAMNVLEIPGTVTQLGNGAFVNSGLNEIVIPNSVKTIGEQAFAMCVNLTKVEIEEGVEKISYSAFENCTKLESVEVPNSVSTIEEYVFIYCDNVTIYAPAGSVAESYAQENEINFKSK